MSYPQTLIDLRNDVLSRLSETSASHAGDLPTGTGGAPTIATLTTITQYLSEAAADLARSCYPVLDSGTETGVTARTTAFRSLTTTAGGTIWAARAVSWTGAALTYCGRSALELNLGPVGLEASGGPAYWFPEGDGVTVYPAPTSPGTLGVFGLAIPAPFDPSDGSATASWLEADLAKLMVFQAAARIARKNLQNPEMAERAPVWEGEFERGRQALLTALWTRDPALARAHYPAPAGAAQPQE